jgi:hypothetical protein
MKRWVIFLGLLAATPALASASSKPPKPAPAHGARDIASMIPAPLAPDVRERLLAGFAPTGTASNDLVLDSTFAGSGLEEIDFNDATGADDEAFRIFQRSDGGYWLLGFHRPTDLTANDEMAIYKMNADGTGDTSFGNGGKLALASDLFAIVDAAMSDDGRLFFGGYYQVSGFTDYDFGVQCVAPDGSYCSGFGSSTASAFADFDETSGGSNQDFPRRLIYADGYLFETGTVDTGDSTTENFAVGIACFDAATGELRPEFTTTGQTGRVFYNLDYLTDGVDQPNDIAYTNVSGTPKLVIVGATQAASTLDDWDDFIMVLEAGDGSYDTNFDGGYTRIFYDLTNTDRYDTATAVTVRRDGSYLMTGYSENDSTSPLTDELTMAVFEPDGSTDQSFADNGSFHGLVVSGYQVPSAVVERRDGDFVISMQIKNDLTGDGLSYLAAQLDFNHSGTSLYGVGTESFPAASGNNPDTQPSGMIIDDHNRIVVAGWRVWSTSTSDSDMMAARLVDEDDIFADGMDGF